MSDATIDKLVFAVLAAIPPTIASLAALRQSRKNSKKVDLNTAITASTNRLAEDLEKKTEHVIDLTNSNLTAVKADLASANQQIKELQSLVAKLAKEKSP